jgi:hypothetical protein
MHFEIDPQYFTSLTVRTVHKRDNNGPDDTFHTLKYGECVSISSIDHPEFTKLREQLGELGFIKIERGWWNGDRVIKPFTLNGQKFKKNNRFVCAAAMAHSINSKYKF